MSDTVDARVDEPHRLRVHQSTVGNCYKVLLDGHELRPAAMNIEFNEAAEYAIAVLRLPVIVENIEALAVLDLHLEGTSTGADPLEEC